jgi:hypothetical protein
MAPSRTPQVLFIPSRTRDAVGQPSKGQDDVSPWIFPGECG